MEKPKKGIGLFVLTLLNASIIVSLTGVPVIARFGFASLFYYILVGIMFFIPTALISAELTSMMPKQGGLYLWVKEAFGEKCGFVTVWLQWFANVLWFPALFVFISSVLADISDPAFAKNQFYLLGTSLAILWLMTFINCKGIRGAALFSSIGIVAGTLLPALILIGIGGYYLFSGAPPQITFSFKTLIPRISSIGDLALLGGVFITFTGIEMTACFANAVRNPGSAYPKSFRNAAIIALLFFILTSLTVSIVVPLDKIGLINGVIEAINYFFSLYHIEYLIPLIGTLILLGAVATMNTFMFSPILGVQVAGLDGNLPPFLQKECKNGMPVNLLILQAIIPTILTIIVFLAPSLSAFFWILVALSVLTYQVMYLVFFLTAIRLRYTHSHLNRPYRIPLGKLGMWVVCILGLISSCFCIFVTFFPPTHIDVGPKVIFEVFLGVMFIVLIAIPFWIYAHKKPSWKKAHED
ncbi:MAG: putative glutamate/gamma-aminobutyrate antiporter [Chlamydiia bacterium]|nr:putative glutamate/gamma-aminobutyrate antiporter [Chlamydiia bacterium]MCH9615762.1 putative glutamate/gamma-aminobutyrate antiporter [Chlamydiia bacterium]MCH9628835.1 putative glutamate/gamma-aminobutyrate antiporter [Chlamydiia bacterium]